MLFLRSKRALHRNVAVTCIMISVDFKLDVVHVLEYTSNADRGRLSNRFQHSKLGCVYTYPDRSGYPDVSAPDRPSVYTKTIEVYAIRSNTLRYLELFENDFKGGSSGCPGALWRRVNGASGYPDVTAHALCGFLRLESGFFLLFASFKNFPSLFSCPLTAQSDLKVFHIASSILKSFLHASTGPISSRSMPSNASCVL